MTTPEKNDNQMNRRDLLRDGLRGACLIGMGLAGGALGRKLQGDQMVWQIDPHKCTSCGNCATYCVLEKSAVKCFHSHAVCGYCELCTGYFEPEPHALNTSAENQLCPTGAITRNFVEDPYHEYIIDKPLCIGCGRCVKGCNAFGNGSLYLQVDHNHCVNCNECSIAQACPADAFSRVPAHTPYKLKGTNHDE